MKLRHLLTTAAVTALAVTPLAFTSAASGAFDAHSLRFNDNSEDGNIVSTIDITKVHLYRTTSGDFRAVVSYKDLVKRPATKWIVVFQDPFFLPDSKVQNRGIGSDEYPEGVAMEYRIGPDGKTAAFGYQFTFFDIITGRDPKPTVCKGFAAKPDFTANTITYSVPRSCWTLNYTPATVSALTRLFSKSEWRSNLMSYDGPSNRVDDATANWEWGGGTPAFPDSDRNPLHRNPFLR